MATRDELKSDLMSSIDDVIPDDVELDDDATEKIADALDISIDDLNERLTAIDDAAQEGEAESEESEA